MNTMRPIINKYLPKNFWHGFQTIKLQVLHDTGNYLKGDTATSNYNYWIGKNNGIAAHAIIDKTQIFETLPPDQKGWHVGGIGNSNSWGVELCNLKTQADFNSQIDDAARYFALIRFKYMGGVDVTKDNLKSHYECNKTMNTGSNHTDVNGYFTHYGYTMDMFRTLVQKYLNELKQKPVASTVEELTNRMKLKELIIDTSYWTSVLKGMVDMNISYLLILFNRAVKLPDSNADINLAVNKATTQYGLSNPNEWISVLNGTSKVNLINLSSLFNKFTN